MNAVGMLFNQFIQSKDGVLQTLNKDATSGQQSVFQRLLTGSGNETDNITNAQSITKDNRELKQMLSGSEDMSELIQLLSGSKEVQKLIGHAVSKEEAMQVLRGLIDSVAEEDGAVSGEALQEAAISRLLTEHGGHTEEVGNMTENKDMPLLFHLQTSAPILSDQSIQNQFEALLAKAENVLAQITDQKSVLKAAPELLKLLEQWTALAKKTNKQSGTLLESISGNNEKNQAIWKELVQSFQKRNQLVMKQQYNSNAKVTSSDVAKWLQHAMQSQLQLDKANRQQTVTSMPMSKVEQYVVHLNQTNTQPIDHQLIEQFQKVMKTSKFMALQNGTSQLNISLRPENLGDMMVKLTQMNGEMTVKIIVTSAAAKDMLEANMHHLKNMFSPQQVVVEKQDVTTQQMQTNQHKEDGQPMDDRDQEQSGHFEQDDHPEDEEDFDEQLQEVLMNEKV
ncbi:flagellar hook-length control protein FliK [Lentibacillus halodurans]|uniref:flagellar hook-length control protein FliK n=1 Tax=Lentibacillus halodurans TaxID=237679 RepID=UPI00147E0F3F|nr:flagellar hook-length control protein FliK [Lentibacillus halodurans]